MNGRLQALLCLAAACTAAACKRTERPAPPAPLPMPAAGAPSPPASPVAPGEYQQRIQAAEQIVQQDPKNVRAWIQLGNDYFDTKQPERAIGAYAKALELEPNNPDVLTDQGVMYREIGAFEKAIANFKRANELNPKHVQSLYNLGVVYANDLKDRAKAAEAWHRVIEIAPGSPQAEQALHGLAELQEAAAPRP